MMTEPYDEDDEPWDQDELDAESLRGLLHEPLYRKVALGLGVAIAAGVMLCVAGCATGYSVDPVSLTPVSAVFEYTYSVSGEYAATVRRAEAHCQLYQRHSKPVGQPVLQGPDRAIASFECVA